MAKLPVDTKTEGTKRSPIESTMERKPILPAVDIFKTKDELVMLVDMPGVPKDEIKVSIDNGIITISGQAKIPQRGDLRYWEFSPCRYQRSFELSPDVDQEKIEADYNQGVLTVFLVGAWAVSLNNGREWASGPLQWTWKRLIMT